MQMELHPLGGAEVSDAQHQGEVRRISQAFFLVPEDSILQTASPEDLKDLRACWQCGEKGGLCGGKVTSHFPFQQIFTVHPPMHIFGHTNKVFHCVQHLLFPR